jgi:hypothetical protein
MNEIENRVWDAAMRRVAEVFNKSLKEINAELIFGKNLKSSFVSDFRGNELDIINDDIHDVADCGVAKDIASGKLDSVVTRLNLWYSFRVLYSERLPHVFNACSPSARYF